jgi:hypothetical protein
MTGAYPAIGGVSSREKSVNKKGLSTPSHKYGGIRPPMHPGLLRCSSVKYYRVFSLLAPCRPGASTPSIRHRIYVREYLGRGIIKISLSLSSVYSPAPNHTTSLFHHCSSSVVSNRAHSRLWKYH